MTANRFGNVFVLLILLSGALLPTLAEAKLSAAFDRYKLSMGDTVRMTLSSDGDEDPAEANLDALEAHFEVLQRSSTLNTSIINGERSRVKELILELTPLRQGELVIPPLQVGKQRSEALQVSVGPAPEKLSGDEIVIFEVELDSTDVYVQGQAMLTLRVQQAVNLESRSISELAIDNAVVESLGQNSFQRVIDGRPWLVHEIRYALFPQSSGELRVPIQSFSGRLATGRRSLFDTRPAGRLVRRQTEELVIEVKPRPASYPQATWLPSSALTIEEQWSGSLEDLRIGDSVTRTITVTGEGLQGAQLPPIEGASGNGLRAYPDQPSINSLSGEKGVTGMRTDSLALVAVAEGDYVLPALEIPWWDTKTDSLKTARLPERRIRVAPGAINLNQETQNPAAAGDGTLATSAAAAAPANVTIWQCIAGICALGWMLTTLFLLRKRSSGASLAPKEKQPAGRDPMNATAKSVISACRANDAALVHRQLLQWLATEHAGVSLSTWLENSADEGLEHAVAELQQNLYGKAPTQAQADQAFWNGEKLLAALQRQFAGTGTKRTTRETLAPLYLAGQS